MQYFFTDADALLVLRLSLDLTTLPSDQINSEMAQTEEAIQRITGATPAMTRPPFGK